MVKQEYLFEQRYALHLTLQLHTHEPKIRASLTVRSPDNKWDQTYLEALVLDGSDYPVYRVLKFVEDALAVAVEQLNQAAGLMDGVSEQLGAPLE